MTGLSMGAHKAIAAKFPSHGNEQRAPGYLAAAPPPCEGRTDANAKEGDDDARTASSLCVASDGEDRGHRPRCVRAAAARRGAGVG
jgi:hypothetical protein